MPQKIRQRQRLNLLQRGSLTIGSISLIAVAVYLFKLFNTGDVSPGYASKLMHTESGTCGKILLSYTWNGNEVLQPDKGPGAKSISPNAECVPGGANSTNGLSAGNSMKDINLVIPPEMSLSPDGIDISLDYKRFEEEGSFYSRAKDFNFGIREGKIHIRYRLITPKGKSYLIDEVTAYEVPLDDEFRNIRFIYDPRQGKGEILVNNATVWTNQSVPGCRLGWKDESPVIIGAGMNGEGNSRAMIDNLIVKSTTDSWINPIDLLSFTAELQDKEIMLNWFTAKETGTDYFVIEKSTDTKNYTEVGRIKASSESETLKAYAVIDKNPAPGVTYYRLALNNSAARSVWVPVIAIRLKSEQIYPQANLPQTEKALQSTR